jgi:hypothetical protein
MQQQLRDSHAKLTHLGESFCAFSYPWGQGSRQVVDAVLAAGYECAVAVSGQMRSTVVNPYLLPRIGMKRDLDLKRFRLLLMRTQVETRIRMKCLALIRKGFGRLRIPLDG